MNSVESEKRFSEAKDRGHWQARHRLSARIEALEVPLRELVEWGRGDVTNLRHLEAIRDKARRALEHE